MKKLSIILIAAMMIITALTACSQNADIQTDNEDKLNVVCTIFPEYDWVKQILGSHTDDVDLTMLLDNGVDLHSYQPTADDIIKISTCDIFIYVGGESDELIEDALKESANKDMVVINLLDVLGNTVKVEEVKEGMEAEGDEGSSEEEDETEYDEHVWLSLKNAKTLCSYISDKLCTIDEENAQDYKSNTANYVSKLSALDEEYQQTIDTAKLKTVLFGDRFPFRYMADDYNLDYYAAFVGCSAETEASFETVAFLAGKIDELGIPSVITIEGTEHKIAETIIQNTMEKNQNIVTMDSMQSTTSNDVESGVSYLSVMTENLEVLKTALK